MLVETFKGEPCQRDVPGDSWLHSFLLNLFDAALFRGAVSNFQPRSGMFTCEDPYPTGKYPDTKGGVTCAPFSCLNVQSFLKRQRCAWPPFMLLQMQTPCWMEADLPPILGDRQMQP